MVQGPADLGSSPVAADAGAGEVCRYDIDTRLSQDAAMSAGGWWDARLWDLPEAEAWRLLETVTVGRLAWDDPEGLVVVPMNYAVVERSVWVRTSPYAALARVPQASAVAFEVDQIDEERRTGWSVLVRGVCHHASTLRAPPVSSPAVDSWPEGLRSLHVVIEATTVTAKRLGASA